MDCENADPIYYKCISVGIQRNTAFAAVVFLLLRTYICDICRNGESITLSMFTAAVISFVLNYAAYFAEIFRGGIIGVSKGQYEASKALGLTGIQTMRYVIVPQMIRTVIHRLRMQTIVLVKDTALASSIAYRLVKGGSTCRKQRYACISVPCGGAFYLVI